MYNGGEFIYMMHDLHSKWLQIFEAPISLAIMVFVAIKL